MKFDPIKKSFTISEQDLILTYHTLIFALENIRKMANLPLDKYERKHACLEPVDFAQKAIIDAMNTIGLKVNASWGEQLDLRKE